MFKSPFSFNGMISRREFGLSILICNVGIVGLFFIMLAIGWKLGYFFIAFLLFVMVWFRVAQGTKRCHDIGLSGWHQLIPLFTFVLLFTKSNHINNRYFNKENSIVKGICKIVSIGDNIVQVEMSDGQLKDLHRIVLSVNAKPGDLIQHINNGKYVVVDKDGNLVFRI
ncbi:DUF805 domain-containing protein [Ferruginibacter albus]|uniref:DUF805 domain-containing protein n=1 Tax=Ferruginibacter albus TaxID=2875540 RepID=UPI001CC6815E|nr:DUF805 domain-containing protein [Ferruginibacter albus]UAY50852.1 DUF805 domain-containing protein [Ferruginibacter albus]